MPSRGNGWIAPIVVLSSLIAVMIAIVAEIGVPRAGAVSAAIAVTLTVALAIGLSFVFAHGDTSQPH
jgi:hypothetical protein